MAITADGSRVVHTWSGKTRVWDVAAERVIRTLNTGDSLDLSGDGTLLASGTWRVPRVVVREVATGKKVRVLNAPGDTLDDFSFSADGSTLAAIFSEDETTPDGTRTFYVRVWQVETGAVQVAAEGSRLNFETPLLAFSADGLSTAFATERTISVRDARSGRETAVLALPFKTTHLALSPDGMRVAVGTHRAVQGGEEASVKIFEVATGTEQHTLEDALRARWSRDGRFLLATLLGEAQEDLGGYPGRLREPTLLRADDFTEVGTFVNGKLHKVVLEATPDYLDAQQYRVTGTVQLDDEAPIPFEGIVEGKESQRYLSPQARLPYPAEFSLTLQNHPWKLHAYQDWEQGEGDWQQARNWTGYVEDTTFPPSPVFTPLLELRRAGKAP